MINLKSYGNRLSEGPKSVRFSHSVRYGMYATEYEPAHDILIHMPYRNAGLVGWFVCCYMSQ